MFYLYQMRRREQAVRSVDLTFQGTVSEEEYEEMQANAQQRGCPYCGDTFNVTLGFPGPLIDGRGNRYCSPGCVGKAEREMAVMVKPVPCGTKIDGWDV